MIPIPLQILAAVLVVTAFAALIVAVQLWRRSRNATPRFGALAKRMEDRAALLPVTMGTARIDWAERTAAIEHGLWLIERFDARIEAATVAVREQRATLDRMRERMERNRARAETLKSTARLIMKALELRRTFL